MSQEFSAILIDLIAFAGFLFFIALTIFLRHLGNTASAELSYYATLCFVFALCVSAFDHLIIVNSNAGYGSGFDPFKLSQSKLRSTLMITYHLKYILIGIGILNVVRTTKRFVFREYKLKDPQTPASTVETLD